MPYLGTTQVRANSGAWPSAQAEESIAGIMQSLREMLANGKFTQLLCSHGICSIPELLSPSVTAQVQPAKAYGQSLLEFVVALAFVSKLMTFPPIVSYLDQTWPQFSTEMKMTYLSLLTKGPLARLPWALTLSD